jgi:hypothetical protein
VGRKQKHNVSTQRSVGTPGAIDAVAPPVPTEHHHRAAHSNAEIIKMEYIIVSKAPRNILLSLLGFLGTGALFGGATMIISPQGTLLHMPLSLLDHAPFSSFLVPGLILFLVLGVLPCLLVFALVKKPGCSIAERLNCYADMHWSWSFAMYTAFALIIWIQLEMVFLHAVHWSHTLYMFLAVAIISIALLPAVRKLYKEANAVSNMKDE